MVYNILNIGKTGLKAMQNDLDNTAHNIANSNTIGYKRKNTSFHELLLNESENVSMNAGVKNGVNSVNYSQGNLIHSQRDLDFAIEGEGFFGVRDVNNRLLLTRNGNFKLDSDNNLVDDKGRKVETVVNENEELQENTYEFIIYKPESKGSLVPIDETSFYIDENENLLNSINDEFTATITQGYFEDSNVDMSSSMVDLITTQRAYSANGKIVQTTEEIMNMINGLKR